MITFTSYDLKEKSKEELEREEWERNREEIYKFCMYGLYGPDKAPEDSGEGEMETIKFEDMGDRDMGELQKCIERVDAEAVEFAREFFGESVARFSDAELTGEFRIPVDAYDLACGNINKSSFKVIDKEDAGDNRGKIFEANIESGSHTGEKTYDLVMEDGRGEKVFETIKSYAIETSKKALGSGDKREAGDDVERRGVVEDSLAPLTNGLGKDLGDKAGEKEVSKETGRRDLCKNYPGSGMIGAYVECATLENMEMPEIYYSGVHESIKERYQRVAAAEEYYFKIYREAVDYLARGIRAGAMQGISRLECVEDIVHKLWKAPSDVREDALAMGPNENLAPGYKAILIDLYKRIFDREFIREDLGFDIKALNQLIELMVAEWEPYESLKTLREYVRPDLPSGYGLEDLFRRRAKLTLGMGREAL